VGLLKVKSAFYVRARRTRQTLWSAVVDPLLRGQALDGGAPSGGKARRRGAGVGWEAAEKRLRTGMKALTHVEGCAEHGEEWASVAVGFLHWWRAAHEALGSAAERMAHARAAKDKFGSVYRDYCRQAGLPGGGN